MKRVFNIFVILHLYNLLIQHNYNLFLRKRSFLDVEVLYCNSICKLFLSYKLKTGVFSSEFSHFLPRELLGSYIHISPVVHQ
jgi:hypothetical protein